LPTSHEEIIASWWLNQEFHQEFHSSEIPFDFIDRDKRDNPRFWKSRLKSKKRSEKKKRTSKSNTAPAPISRDEPLSEINMDDITTIIDRYISSFITIDEIPEEIKEEKPFSVPNYQPLVMDTPDWLLHPSSPHQEEYNDEWEESSEDEDELIRLALDLAAGEVNVPSLIFAFQLLFRKCCPGPSFRMCYHPVSGLSVVPPSELLPPEVLADGAPS
jgi:hypothetical protein